MSDYAHDITLTPDEQRRVDDAHALLARRPDAAVSDATVRQVVALRMVDVCRRLGVRL